MKIIAGKLAALAVGLFVLGGAGPARTAPVCNVRDFGARGDGKTLDTRPIQAAIDLCAGRGGTVYLGQGTYVSGTLRLKSHLTLKLDHGATLAGSHDIKRYWASSSIGLGHAYGGGSQFFAMWIVSTEKP